MALSLKPFLIFALPRSRTAWLSRFLSYGSWHCGHEELQYMRSPDEMCDWLSVPRSGSIETAAAPWWRIAAQLDARFAVIRRPVGEVMDSLLRIPGVGFQRDALAPMLARVDRKLDQIEARLPCMSVNFADLDDEGTCARLFEYCLPYAHDHQHWAALALQNIQVDVPEMVRYCAEHQDALDDLARTATSQCLSVLRSRRGKGAREVLRTADDQRVAVSGMMRYSSSQARQSTHRAAT